MVRLEAPSVSVGGDTWGKISVSVRAECDTQEEVADWLAALDSYAREPKLGEGPCSKCVENNRRFEEAKVRFEQVAAKIRGEAEQAQRTAVVLRNELREAQGTWTIGKEDLLRRTEQRQAELQLELGRTKEELERTRAALAKAVGKDMPQGADSDPSLRFAKLEVD